MIKRIVNCFISALYKKIKTMHMREIYSQMIMIHFLHLLDLKKNFSNSIKIYCTLKSYSAVFGHAYCHHNILGGAYVMKYSCMAKLYFSQFKHYLWYSSLLFLVGYCFLPSIIIYINGK